MGFEFSIGGQKYNSDNLPENVKLSDVDNEQMRRTLELFDTDSQKGVLSKSELEKASLFFKTGSVSIIEKNGENTEEFEINAENSENGAIRVLHNIIDAKDNFVRTVQTEYDKFMNRTSVFEQDITHNEENSHEDIVSKKTEFSETNPDGQLVFQEKLHKDETGLLTRVSTDERVEDDGGVEVMKHTTYNPDGSVKDIFYNPAPENIRNDDW